MYFYCLLGSANFVDLSGRETMAMNGAALLGEKSEVESPDGEPKAVKSPRDLIWDSFLKVPT